MIQKAINETLGAASRGVATAVGVSNLARQAKADELSLQRPRKRKRQRGRKVSRGRPSSGQGRQS